MLQRDFFSYGEICDALGADEAIRQTLLRGALPAYLELRGIRARYTGPNGQFPAGKFPTSGTTLDCSWTHIGPATINHVGGLNFRFLPLDEYTLDGWFRLSPASLQYVARHNSFKDFPSVVPPGEYDPVAEVGDMLELCYYTSQTIKGSARHQLETDFLLKTASRNDLWFRAVDFELLKAQSEPMQVATDKLPSTPKLRSDREQNLLRVIAGLWALSGLPPEHNVTADKLSALFDGWKWDKPAKQTIADTILKEAANLPGAGIRKSDG